MIVFLTVAIAFALIALVTFALCVVVPMILEAGDR